MKKRYLLTSLLILFIGLLGLQSCAQESPAEVLSSEKSILSYSVKIEDVSFEGKIDSEKKEIVIKDIPYDSDISELKPIFTISKEAKISIGGKVQESGVSVVDFSEPVIYTVTAQDKSTVEWTVKLIKKDPPPSYKVVFHKNIPDSDKDETILYTRSENESLVFPELYLDNDDWVLLGWSKTKDSVKPEHYVHWTYTVTGDTEFWGIWKKNTASYTVKIYKQNLDNSYPEQPEIIESKGVIGKEIEYDISEYTGFELDKAKVKTAYIYDDGLSVLNIYLKRKTFSYKVNFYLQSLEGSYSDTPDETKTLTGKYEADAAYDISSYSGFTVDEDKTGSAKISADGSTSVDVYLKRNTATYTIKYFKANLYQIYDNSEPEIVTSTGIVGADVTFDSNKYTGFYLDEEKTNVKDVKISGNNSTVVNVYYKRKNITIKVFDYYADVEGNYPETPVTRWSENTVYVENMGFRAMPDDGFEPTVESITITEAECNDDTYTFIFYYNRKELNYTVKYYIEKADSNTYELNTTETKKGIFGTQMQYDEKDFGDHIAFEKVEYSTIDKNIKSGSYVSVYYKREQVTFTYKWNYEGSTDTIRTYKYGQTITPLSTTRELYSFDGWTPAQPSIAEKDTVFEAKWTFLAGRSGGPGFIKSLPDTIYVKTQSTISDVYLNAYASNRTNIYHTLYKSNDGINWAVSGTLLTSTSANTLNRPITISNDGNDAYFCMRIAYNQTGPYTYSNICRVVTNSQETENIGSYYYSDGTYSGELDSTKTVVGIVAALKDDKTPKMIIPVSFSTSSGYFDNAVDACEAYSDQEITDWSLPDFNELQSILLNANAINDSLRAINSSLTIYSYSYNNINYYWAKKETGTASNVSLALCISSSYKHYLEEKSTSYIKGFYLPVKVLE